MAGGTYEIPYHDRSSRVAGTGISVDRAGRSNVMLVTRPPHGNAYEFIVISALRAQQLLAGCTPRLSGEHTPMVMAQMEVAAGQVARADPADEAPKQCVWQR